MFRRLCWPRAALIALAGNFAADGARADTSCTTLFNKLRQQAGIVVNGQKQRVNFMWTTAYSIPELDARFMGAARGQLALSGPDLWGPAYRVETNYDFRMNPLSQKKSQLLYIGFLYPGKIKISVPGLGPSGYSAVYGPFDAVCANDKFAVVYSGDSVETFAFVGAGPERKNLAEGFQ